MQNARNSLQIPNDRSPCGNHAKATAQTSGGGVFCLSLSPTAVLSFFCLVYVSVLYLSLSFSPSHASTSHPMQVLARHFGEWGRIEEISIKPRIGCTFIRYVNRTAAEFAKVCRRGGRGRGGGRGEGRRSERGGGRGEKKRKGRAEKRRRSRGKGMWEGGFCVVFVTKQL